MAITKIKGRYYVSVYVGYKDGKRIYERIGGFRTKEEAKSKEIELKKNVIDNGHTVREKKSFVSVTESFLLSRKNICAPSTYDQNEYYCYHYIMPYFEKYMIDMIDAQDISNFMHKMTVGPATINKTMNILSQIFDLAILYKYIKFNPCIGIKKPKIKKKTVKTYKPSDIKEFLNLDDVKSSTGYLAFCIIFATGMRPGEVCGLRWCDIFDDHLIPDVGIDKHRRISNLKNELAHQSIFINTKIQSELKQLKTIRKEQCFKYGRQFKEDDFIFCFEPDFRPFTPDYLRKSMCRILKKNGMEHIYPYCARHSFGTNMLRNNVNPKKVSEAMRHSSVKTTLDLYSHVDDNMKKEVFDDYSAEIM